MPHLLFPLNNALATRRVTFSNLLVLNVWLYGCGSNCFTSKHVQLMGRVFNILHENNPGLTRDRRRTVMRPPQVLREGTKKTIFANLVDICNTYGQDLLDFLLHIPLLF